MPDVTSREVGDVKQPSPLEMISIWVGVSLRSHTCGGLRPHRLSWLWALCSGVSMLALTLAGSQIADRYFR